MSSDAWGALAACVMCLAALLGFVWNAAKTATSHDLRIGSLETRDSETRQVMQRLTDAVNRLDRTLYGVRSVARASQGQFDESERPPRE